MATSENLISIPGRLHSVATEGHVAGADEIYDDSLSKTQEEINRDVNNALEQKASKQGYFPDLHSGLADNMFGSTQTNDQFMFRPTAGIQDIESGEAPLGGGTISKVEGNTVVWNQLYNNSSPSATTNHIYLLSEVNDSTLSRSISGTISYTSGSTNRMCIDLTLMFRKGNEPSTIEEFESWLETNIGLKDYYPYNEGELTPVRDYKVKSVGFNALANGTTKVLGGQTYEIVGTYTSITLDGETITPASGKFTPSNNGTLVVSGYDDTTCVHLSYDDDKDGTYEPHWEHEVVIPTTKIYGKLSGSGEYVQVFPDGMKKAGSIADVLDLKNGSATKKIAKTTFSQESIIYDNSFTRFESSCSGDGLKKPDRDNVISDKLFNYPSPLSDASVDKCLTGFEGTHKIYIHEFAYTSVSDFLNEYGDDAIYYELNTYLTYTDLIIRDNGVDTPLSEISYKVDNYGTEEIILGNDTSVVGCTPTMTIKYGINATDALAELPHSYVSGTGNQNFSEAQKTTARNNIGAISQIQLDALTRHTRKSDFDLAVLKQAVADQNLEKYGLKVGDYKTINGHDYVIAGLNCMKGTHVYTCTTDHVGLIVIPHTTQAWNASGNTYTGADDRGAGYKNSDLHYYLKETVLPMCQTDLGANNLIAHSKLLSNAVNQSGVNRYGEATGCSSGWDWEADCKICALSEVQVYGSTIWSSSGFDTGEANQQLEVFRYFNKNRIFGNDTIWLRDITYSYGAAHISNSGDASGNNPAITYGVAALVLFH